LAITHMYPEKANRVKKLSRGKPRYGRKRKVWVRRGAWENGGGRRGTMYTEKAVIPKRPRKSICSKKKDKQFRPPYSAKLEVR